MSNFFLLFLSVFLTTNTVSLRARHKNEPYVKYEKDGVDMCPGDDPLHPCPSVVYGVVNPLSYPVEVQFYCGFDLTNVCATLEPKQITEVVISQEITGRPSCLIVGWSRKR